MVSVMKAGTDRRQIGLLSLLLVISLCRGEIYDKPKMEPVEEHTSTDVERCVRPLTPEAMLKVLLMVKSTAANVNIIYDAGISLIERDLLFPLDTWHSLTVRHGVADFKHILKVEMDNKTVAFNHTQKGQWYTSSHSFGKIQLSVKGKVEIVDCKLLAATVGEMYDKPKMQPVEEHTSTDVERCVRPLTSEAMLKVLLMVKSTAANVNIIYDAGISLIERDLLFPLDTWHSLTVRHGVADFKHILKVEMDNKTVAFNHTQKGQWYTSSHSFGKIQLSVKGKVEIVDCKLLAATVGEMYDKPKMQPVEEHTSTDVERCVRPLTSEAMLKVLLMVKSTANNFTYDAGTSLIKWDVSPVDTWHTLGIKHGVADFEVRGKHILKVETDKKTVAFNHTQNGQWYTSSYSFGKIQLSVKGKVEIADCNLLAPTVEESWVWSLGGVGGVPVVPLTIVAVVVLAVLITLGVVWWRRRRSQSKNVTSKAVQLDSIRHTGYEPIDTREEKEGGAEGPRENEGVVRDPQLDQMDDSYGPQVNHGRPLTSFSNSGT